jgi:hypothetical protein
MAHLVSEGVRRHLETDRQATETGKDVSMTSAAHA